MTSAFGVITEAIIAELQAAPAVCERVNRCYARTIAEQYDDAISVQFDGTDPNRGAMRGAPVDWFSQFTIDVYAKSSTQSGDQAVDELIKKVYERMALDETLAGLVIDIGAPVIRAEYDETGQKSGWVRMTYPIQHRTANGSLE